MAPITSGCVPSRRSRRRRSRYGRASWPTCAPCASITRFDPSTLMPAGAWACDGVVGCWRAVARVVYDCQSTRFGGTKPTPNWIHSLYKRTATVCIRRIQDPQCRHQATASGSASGSASASASAAIIGRIGTRRPVRLPRWPAPCTLCQPARARARASERSAGRGRRRV